MECLCTDLGVQRHRQKARLLVSSWLQTGLNMRPFLVESTKLEKRSCSSPRLHTRPLPSLPPSNPAEETLAVDGSLRTPNRTKTLQAWDPFMQLQRPVGLEYRSSAFDTLENWHIQPGQGLGSPLTTLLDCFWSRLTKHIGSELAPHLLDLKAHTPNPTSSVAHTSLTPVHKRSTVRPQRFPKKTASKCLSEAVSEAATPVNLTHAGSESPDCLVASFEAGRSVPGLRSDRLKAERGGSVRPSRPSQAGHLPPIARKPTKTPERRPHFPPFSRVIVRNAANCKLNPGRFRAGLSPTRVRHSDSPAF
jgi:hypothetical protein